MHIRLLSVLIIGLMGCGGCQQPEQEGEEKTKPADFEKMVIIQDQNATNTIGGENNRELKVR